MAPALYKNNWIGFIEYVIENHAYALFDHNEQFIELISHSEYTNQPQLHTIGNSHGRYRKTCSPLYSNPVGQPGGAVSAGTSIRSGPFVSTAISAAIAAAIADTDNSAISDAGIRAGEIIARRCWLIENYDLFSVYMMDYRWYPNRPAIGNVAEGLGVHAFKNDYDLGLYMTDHGYNGHYILISGTVSLWGEIAEHERGYRAEYAKILSLDTTDPYLKRKYGV